MVIACPACGKTNDLRLVTVCARCACDLAPLAQIVDGALWRIKAAARDLRAGDPDEALQHAQESWALFNSPRAAQAAFAAATALGDTSAAMLWMRRAEQDTPRHDP